MRILTDERCQRKDTMKKTTGEKGEKKKKKSTARYIKKAEMKKEYT